MFVGPTPGDRGFARLPGDLQPPAQPPIRQLQFCGALVPSRTFAAEFVHQHMDADLDQAGFHGKVDALDLFLG